MGETEHLTATELDRYFWNQVLEKLTGLISRFKASFWADLEGLPNFLQRAMISLEWVIKEDGRTW